MGNTDLSRTAKIVSAVILATATTAYADSTQDLIDALASKGVLTEEEALLISKNKTKETKAQAKVKLDKKGLQVSSGDGNFEMKIGGRLHATYTNHSVDSLSSDDPVDGTEIRRARLYATGKFYKKFGYMAEVDWGGDKTSIKDFYGTYEPNDNWVLTAGNQKHAFSMEIQESSNDIMFAERSFVSALSTPYFDRAIGVNLKSMGETWNIQGGVYGDGVQSHTDDGQKQKDEGKGYAVRGTWNPLLEKDRMIMIGSSLGYREASDDGRVNNNKSPSFAYSTTNMSNLKVINTGTVDGFDSIQLATLELAAMDGPFSVQSEIARGTVSRTDGFQDYDVSAYYVQGAYSLTGETRSYKATDGEFKRLKPNKNFDPDAGTWGAWELALRHDAIDLNDVDLTGSGEAKRLTANVNWYLNENMRVVTGWERTYDITNAAVTKANGSDIDNIDVFQMRFQWAF